MDSVDCRMMASGVGDGSVAFCLVNGARMTHTQPAQGHAMYSLRAEQSQQGMYLGTVQNNVFWFHGCEITKVN